MNILTLFERVLLPRLRGIDTKDFFNRVLSERKGNIPANFFPIDIWKENLSLGRVNFDDPKTREIFFHYSVGYTWAVTKPEYKIPEKLLPEIIDSEFPSTLPLAVLKTLPHWTGYVDLSQCPIKDGYGTDIEGFFITTVEHWSGRKGVTLLFPYDDTNAFPAAIFFPTDTPGLTMGDVLLVDPTIQRGMADLGVSGEEGLAALRKDGTITVFEKLLNVALFVAHEFGVEDNEKLSIEWKGKSLRRNGKHYSLRFLNAHKVLRVGERYVTERVYNGRINRHGRAATVRRAHWHGYWTGPRDDPEKRVLKVLWSKATVVAGTRK